LEKSSVQITSRFAERSIRDVLSELSLELERFGAAEGPTVTVNLKLNNARKIGFELAPNRGESPAASVWFSKDGKSRVIAIDRYCFQVDNLWAICRTISAWRQIERDGGPEVLSQVMSSFRELPPPPTTPGYPWSVLGIDPTDDREEIAEAFKERAMVCHPDHGGSGEAMRQLLSARDAALKSTP
jgi:hypothetical protein